MWGIKDPWKGIRTESGRKHAYIAQHCKFFASQTLPLFCYRLSGTPLFEALKPGTFIYDFIVTSRFAVCQKF